jgi:hypothetical protein
MKMRRNQISSSVARLALWLVPTAGLALLSVTSAGSDGRVTLLPQLKNGETLRYESHARIERHVKTKSNVLTILQPRDLRKDVSTLVGVSIQEIHMVDNRLMMAAETTLESEGPVAAENSAQKAAKVSFTIGGDGELTRATGLGDLDPERRLVWQFWVAQFAYGWTLPG